MGQSRSSNFPAVKSPFRSALLALAGICIAPAVAHATPLSAGDVLQQFNLVVFGNSESYSHVDGRSYIGGNLTGRSDYVQHPADTPSSAYAGLTVMGNASGANVNGLGAVIGGSLANSNINSGFGVVSGNAGSVNFNGGPAYVGGSTSATNFNGGRVNDLSTAPSLLSAYQAAGSTNFPAAMSSLSQYWSALADTGSSVAVNGGKATFNAAANADHIAVFNLTGIDIQLFSLWEFEFNLNGATTVIFNTDETTYDIHANFLGGSAASIAPYVVWNFYKATDILLENQFGGVVLAPHAKLTNRNNIEGTVVVDSLRQYGEIHEQMFRGDPPGQEVPEPGSLLLLSLGIFGIAASARRRAAS